MKVWITECYEWDHAYANQTKAGALNGIIEYLEMELAGYENEDAQIVQDVKHTIQEINDAMNDDDACLSFDSPFGYFYVTETTLWG